MSAQRSVSVVLIGAPGAGKSTLAQALLASAGAPPATAPEPWRLAYGSFVRAGTTVSLLDPPGSPELAGELHAGLRGASAVVLVVSPVQGVDPRTVALWESLAHLPRLVVLSQLDRPGADADEAVALCRRLLGDDVLPLQLPLHDDDGSVGGVLDLLHLTVSEGGARRAAEPEHVTLVEALRGELVEAVLTGSEDDELFEGYLADVEPSGQVLAAELAAALARGDLQPVLVAVPRRGVGLDELAELLAGALPPAADQPLSPDPDALVAEVLRPGLLRVWSGELRPGMSVQIGPRRTTYDGPAACAGELVAADVGGSPGDAVGLSRVELEAWRVPPAAFPVGVAADDALAARVLGDPVARLETDPRTGQLLLWTYGPEHAEALLAGLPSAPVRVPPGARPVRLRVQLPAWAVRPVRTDLLARGGQVLQERADGDGVVLDVQLPPAEAVGYALPLARVSGHTAVLQHDDMT
ncbi:MAG TPA: GTP-binding protein [Mycobacteriales bacterium]|jgi:elongation factor G|nr:GTP-binding protein [Mycobacteriales bacterium]